MTTLSAALLLFLILDPLGNIPNINVSSATMDANGMILANDLNGAELYEVDYMATCGPGMVTGLGSYDMSGSTILFGLEFASDGTLALAVGATRALRTDDPRMDERTLTRLPLAWHLIWNTYGTWLPGDARGWNRRGDPRRHPPSPPLEAAVREPEQAQSH